LSDLVERDQLLAEVPILRDVASVRELVASWRQTRRSIAFVPTMGNLHDGHLSLTTLAAATADVVIMSIFVNPTQFGPAEDFGAYPRTFDDDIARVTAAGTIAALFVPDVPEIYPFGLDAAVRLTLPPLARELCGASRPGHFDGVASVVCRLLNIVTPDVLVLGQKDYQQFVLVERLITDLRLPVRAVCGATAREPDGLALSSRNRYLTGDERHRAPALHRALAEMRERLRAGESNYRALESRAIEHLRGAGFRPDYVEVRRAADLAKPEEADRSDELVVLAAAWLGRARLIDNLRV
jgi:pantoate--beta-alanine ligase